MNKFNNKTVFITGASRGIGASCAAYFARAGARLILCARSKDSLSEVYDTLRHELNADIHIIHLDIGDYAAVKNAIHTLPAEWKTIDILINNAGLALELNTFQEGLIANWDEMINTNVKGLLYVTREILPQMVKRNSGHIINIGSIAGRQVYQKGAVYCATKHAVKALSEGLRYDLSGTKIRVSNIEPGMVETNFSVVRFGGNKERADALYQGFDPLTPDDIADVILYCASCPPHVNISEVFIMPTAQASATMVAREES